jgi:hypothetical protein
MTAVGATTHEVGMGGLTAPEVTTGTHVSRPAAGRGPVTRVVVAVHGIGDQQSFATIQAVVNQFCTFYCEPAGVPLGNFHTKTPGFTLGDPYPDEPFGRFAFAEAYWAKIPRQLVAESHTVEEAKKWARTIVERLRLRWSRKPAGERGAPANFPLVNQVLGEMIETIAVLDRLCFLAAKAGVFTFNLRTLLDDSLGDVQVVAEFEDKRIEILAAFSDVMQTVGALHPNAEIHIVAHSEGTVVAFLGLLEAYRTSPQPAWTRQVRGLMTLGSPIDKHLVLWPELFGTTPPSAAPQRPIEWRNYYDHGDPVGFALDDARKWIARRGWRGVFDFDDAKGHDIGFTRYPFPGKAHVDYWNDGKVFGHFIDHVVLRPPSVVTGSRTGDAPDPTRPRDRLSARFACYVLP